MHGYMYTYICGNMRFVFVAIECDQYPHHHALLQTMLSSDCPPSLHQGTQVYDAQKGAFVDLGILDVLQIFGRAGRPQYHSEGEGIIITSHDKLAHYLSLITRQSPIESKFNASLTDNLNAEVQSPHLCLSLLPSSLV